MTGLCVWQKTTFKIVNHAQLRWSLKPYFYQPLVYQALHENRAILLLKDQDSLITLNLRWFTDLAF